MGIGADALWEGLCAGRSGVGEITTFDASSLPVRLAAEVKGFDPVAFVKPRKALKVMARDAQLGIAAAKLAYESAGLDAATPDPERFGVVFGADKINGTLEDTSTIFRGCVVDGVYNYDLWGTTGYAASYPLNMLRLLPNMITCHISIAHDARGPNNTVCAGETSGLLSIGEAAAAIERGWADVMLAGGASSRVQPTDWVHDCLMFELSRRHDDPARASRPFDRDRDGQVRGEGAACVVLEDREHAIKRGAKIYARVVNWASGCDPRTNGHVAHGTGLRRAIRKVMKQANLSAGDIGHINAHGASTIAADRVEAQVLRELLPDVPVTAPKGSIGQLFSASGVTEAIASVLALEHGLVPPTCNYETPDPACAVRVVHGAPLETSKPLALLVNQTFLGQAAAVVLRKDEG